MKTTLNSLNIKFDKYSLAKIQREGAVALDCLSRDECEFYQELIDKMSFRQAKPITGSSVYPVHQDFELNYSIPEGHLLWALVKKISSLIKTYLKTQRHDAEKINSFEINDLIVQRYPAGCKGISPHRDHIKYRLLVLILLISGDGDFKIHADRSGEKSKDVIFKPGQILIMGGPGICNGFNRPYHSVSNISINRRTIGMRFNPDGKY
tara:strand:- start:482 stop:1105 length:624 start_codon:yes stop_codon:yes gene_type:complete